MKQDNIPLSAFGALEKQSGRSTYRPLDRKQDTRAHKNRKASTVRQFKSMFFLLLPQLIRIPAESHLFQAL